MKSYVIAIPDHQESQLAANKCIQSSKDLQNNFTINKFTAITPPDVDGLLKEFQIKWNYPWEGKVTDFSTGLTKSAYSTNNPKARIACALSHYQLWKNCYQDDIPYLILEHDAIFIHQLDYQFILDSKYDIIGINNPLMATRRAQKFYDAVKGHSQEIQPVPDIDEFNIPQGLAGNSAYIIKPAGAANVLAAVDQYGAWPNDAIMCKQLIPNMGVTRRFYTKVQGLPSTTTG